MRFRPRKYPIPDVMIRERILEAAFFEFGEKGFHDTNVDTITKRIGVSRVVFYAYFKNKKEVLVCLLETLKRDLSAFFIDRRGQKLWLNIDNIDVFQQPVIYVSEILDDSSGVVRALVQGMLMDEELFLQFFSLLEDVAAIFEPKIKSIQNKGYYQGGGTAALSRIMAVALLMSIFSVSIGAFRCSIETLAKQLSIFYFSFFNFGKKGTSATDHLKHANRKAEKTKKMILDAARHEFSIGEKSSVTIAAIAKRAGINRSTVYLHFKKKEAISKELSNVTEQTIGTLERSYKRERGESRPGIRKEIIEAAKQIFSDRGYIDTTIDMIAAMASCSRRTIYKYFMGKDGIISAIFDEMFMLFHPAIKESDSIIHQADTMKIDSLMEINSLVIDIFEKYANVYRTLLQGSLQSGALRVKFIEIYERIDKPLQKKINELKKEGKCKAVCPIIASRIIQTYQAHSIWMFHAGIIQCTKQELVIALSQFQFSFFNFQ